VSGTTIRRGELLTAEEAAEPWLAIDLLEAKYRRPRLREGLVWRTELLGRLHDARAASLVLIAAPAGYGKTTLLAQWSELDDRPFAWITLDETDRDPDVLAESISSALKPAGMSGAGFVVVLDDAHVGQPDVLKDAVFGVLDWLPAGSQVAIAARSEPLLPLSWMRAHRMVFEVRADELAMPTVEAASLFRNAGLDLATTDVEDLTRRTEGWPVVLELAAASISAQRDPAEALARLAGDDHLISEYFRAEIMDAVSPATMRFLMRSSVLDRMSGPVCDAVLERTRSAAVLAKVAVANVPLRPADASHEWYRLNPMFREMLQTELRRTEPEVRSGLHRRAGDWHRQAGDLDRAIDHACAAGDLDRSGMLLWDNLPGYLGQGRNDAVQHWLNGITADQVSGSATFALTAAHSHLASGSVAVAEHWARSATVALSRRTAGSDNEHRAGTAIIAAWAARSGPARMSEDAARAYDLLPYDSPWRANCCFLRGTAALLIGDAGAAARQLEEGSARGASLAFDSAALCLAQLAVVALDHDDGELTGDLARRAAKEIDRHGLSSYPAAALVFAVSATAGVGQRRMDEAKAAASKCATLLSMLEDFAPWYGAETRILLARSLLVLGDVASAREHLADASRLARRVPGAVVFQQWFDDAWEQFDKRAETALVGVGSLTMAELRVLRLLPTHFSFREIADRLHVSANTVKTHAHAVYRKLDASSRTEAVANATGAGLIGY
jgi:LuxR family maltose regulon positive regulatory protein